MNSKRKVAMTREMSQVSASQFWKGVVAHNNRLKPTIDELVKKYTAAATLDELCELGKATSYRPSIYVKGCPEKKRLADAYDDRQAELGDARRAFRGW